jgi:hypothetical protein
MKQFIKVALPLISALGLVACAGNSVKTQNYSVESFSKDDILVFVKKGEYKKPEYEKEKNALILSCSKSLSSKDYKVSSRVIKESDASDYLVKGAVLVRVYDDQTELPTGENEKTLYIKFERLSEKTRYIIPIHGIKATMIDKNPFSYENIDTLCQKAVNSISFEND